MCYLEEQVLLETQIQVLLVKETFVGGNASKILSLSSPQSLVEHPPHCMKNINLVNENELQRIKIRVVCMKDTKGKTSMHGNNCCQNSSHEMTENNGMMEKNEYFRGVLSS
ncbi:unnamed protein product [Lepeophtheirus salmonis]|uniref:(salmon louse) hypothetical protein n=1 Tax=Lepeophtheirus salmonis TaxID=72036 RepID=A0A7R8CNG0_LEPSM|nr:unnamed protein product [Lepeophtheirus salmonis]CAF2829443.1 unnamed protein product [Lepeophtheirus salmonis]